MISPEFKKPRKILITGSVGSGKSTCARKLAGKTGLPYYELDSIAHPEEGSPEGRSPEEQRAVLEKIDQGGFWIMEGTDRKHQRYLFDWAERIIFLDTPPQPKTKKNYTPLYPAKVRTGELPLHSHSKSAPANVSLVCGR
jgi:adenylate kinase family enzyme